MSKKILIIEDDENIICLERDYLEAHGFEVLCANDGIRGLEIAKSVNISLVLLDIMLPSLNGLEVCKRIREFSNIPILLVSAKKDEFDKINGLGFGADDYIVKPFSPSELVARVIAHINRYERLTNADTKPAEVLEINDLKIDKKSRRIFFKDTEITFTNKEFDLLTTLAENPDTVFTKDELLSEIWNYDSMGDTSTVTVHINRVREKLSAIDKDMEYINTVWGKGYRFNK